MTTNSGRSIPPQQLLPKKLDLNLNGDYSDFEAVACQAGEYQIIPGGAIIPPTTDDC